MTVIDQRYREEDTAARRERLRTLAKQWQPAGASVRSRGLSWLALLLAMVFFALPIVYLFATSLKTPGEILQGTFFPSDPTFENWPAAFTRVPLAMFLRNSFVAALLSVVITIVIAVPGTYAMVRLKAGAWFLPDLTLASYVAPPIVAVIPLFFLLQALRLTDTIWGLSFIYGLMNTPVAFWLMRGFVRHIPEEIDEAAWIDGAGYWRTMLMIVMPLLAPGMVATALICMILSYNEFLFASAMTFSPASRTLTVGISLFQGERLVNFGQMAAASLAGSIPVYLIAVLFQRWLIGGLVSGGLK